MRKTSILAIFSVLVQSVFEGGRTPDRIIVKLFVRFCVLTGFKPVKTDAPHGRGRKSPLYGKGNF